MRYRFGDYALDPQNYELSKNGVAVALEPQVFSLILLLIENRERVVTKDELIDTVWNGRIVSEATLSSRVSAARRAIGDSGATQTVIRTIPRRGFRFVAPVDADAAHPNLLLRRQPQPRAFDSVRHPTVPNFPMRRPAAALPSSRSQTG